MQKGWKRIKRKQNFRSFFSIDGKKACALGCVYLGLKDDHSPTGLGAANLLTLVPRLDQRRIKCLPKPKNPEGENTLFAQIFLSNDKLKMSIPKIIKALKKCGL